MYPFERFTERAKMTLTLAQEEAERSHHSYIGTEHLLVALLRQADGDAADVLRELEIDLVTVRQTIASVLGRNERILIQQIIPTSRVKAVIEIAFEEAWRVGHESVDTGHLLMALVMEGEGIAAHVLEDLGATAEKVIAALERRWAVGPTGRGKRPLSSVSFPSIPFPHVPVRRWREMTVLAGGHQAAASPSYAEGLRDLLANPDVAALLQKRGLDTDRLRSELLRPPEAVQKLRHQLVTAKAQVAAAVGSNDYTQAGRLQKTIDSVSKKLQRAETDWLKSLSS
jgi:hypothetical protein